LLLPLFQLLALFIFMSGYSVNPNLTFLNDNFHKEINSILAGGSRSGKTWSSVDFMVLLASRYAFSGTLNIIKETYNSYKTTLYEDFNRRLPMYGISSPFADRQEVRTFKLFDLKINLLGADSDSVLHGVGSDLAYFNELMDIDKKIFDQIEQRCRLFLWGDLNPKFTDHWVYDNLYNRPDYKVLKTTLFDNPHVSEKEKKKILSYEPTPENIKNGTADIYLWEVYGLGNAAAPEGLVYPHVTWIEEFPTNIEEIYYGLDFGYTNAPMAITKVGVHKNNLYAKIENYAPSDNLTTHLLALEKAKVDKQKEIWADSADGVAIGDIRRAGYKIFPVNKFDGSVEYGVSLVKRFKLHIVDSKAARKEQQNYKYAEVNGIKLDKPAKGNDHFWDTVRYVALSKLRFHFEK
jgi:phage terminase large subunit